MYKFCWLTGITALALAATSHAAGTGAVPRENSAVKIETAHCIVSASTERNGHARVHTSSKTAQNTCAITEDETAALLSDIFSIQSDNNDPSKNRTIMIGRIQNYAWLQQHLIKTAERDPAWSRKTKRPKSGHANRYVNRVLGSPAIVRTLNRVAWKHGFNFTGADCEKIFISKDGLPYDGTCWIVFEAR